jgi:hypothetical protein
MALTSQIVVSASRRTDIPAFYMDWFFEQLHYGAFEVENPFNHHVRKVPVSTENVHSFVFWSKNFGPFLSNQCGERLQALGYHLFFNFSINSANKLLEPNVPPLSERLDQLKFLCQRFGAKSITWRFDPICFYRLGQGTQQNNMSDFEIIAQIAADYGITRCTTSFLDLYGKVRRRAKKLFNIVFEDPPLEKKIILLHKMAEQLRPLKIALMTCCEQEIITAVNDHSVLTAASCIPNNLLMELYGGNLSLKKDSGQRVKAGCGCKTSVDIGSYGFHPCHHSCIYCYANPVCDDRYRS